MNLKSKKIVVFILSFILLISSNILSASALSAGFIAKADYKVLKAGDTFNVNVALNNIKNSAGIVLVQFFLHYDSKCLKLKEWKNSRPQIWGNGYEELTAPKTDEKNPDDTYLSCAYMYSGNEKNKGVYDDGVLFTNITFEVLSDKADGTVLRLDNTEIMDDSNKYVSCNSQGLKINFNGAELIENNEYTTAEETQKSSFDINNFLKILIAAAAVLITAGAGFYIGKRLSKKNKQ
jgi:hypothetical protein